MFVDDTTPARESTLINDSLASIRKQLAQVPLDKKGALVIAATVDKNLNPTVHSAVAVRVGGGWEIAADGFVSKVDRGMKVTVGYTW